MYIPECRITYRHKDGRTYSGNLKSSGLRARVYDRSGEISITLDPAEPIRLESFTMSFHWMCEADERIFMNGFRSDSPCRETDRDNRAALLPASVRRHLGVSAAVSLFGGYDIGNGAPMGCSYCYFRTSRNVYRLVASDDEHGGYTLFQYDKRDTRLYVSKDVEGIELRPGEYRLLSIRIYDGTMDQVFDAWFGQLGVTPRHDAVPEGGYITSHRGYSVDALSVRNALDALKKLDGAVRIFAVANGWQKRKGDWEPDPVRFPFGMAEVASDIHKAGLSAALWLAPFAADKRSALLKEHPDWALRDGHGHAAVSPMDHQLAALDIWNEEVREYIRGTVGKALRDWGFDMVIAGDLYMAGIIPHGGSSRADAMYEAMDLLREAAGDAAVMAADVPLMPAFGRVEYCHMSNGVLPDDVPRRVSIRSFMDAVSADRAECDALYRRQMDGRAWINAPQEYRYRRGSAGKEALYAARAQALGMAGGLRLVCGDLSRGSDDFIGRVKENMTGRNSIRRVFDKDRHVLVEFSEGDEVRSVRIY